MTLVTTRAVIAAPLETVRAVIEDVAAYPQWADGVREATVVDEDELGRPSRARFVVTTPMGTVSYTLAYTHEDASQRWQLVEGEMLRRLDGLYTFTAEGATTVIDARLDLEIDLPLPELVTRQAAEGILARAVESLRARVEAADAT